MDPFLLNTTWKGQVYPAMIAIPISNTNEKIKNEINNINSNIYGNQMDRFRKTMG